MPTQRQKKLTKQEKRFVEIKAETGNGTLAAKEAFGIEDSNYAGVKAHDLLRSPKIQNAIADALPDDLLAKVHVEGLHATRHTGTGGMVINTEDGEFGHTDVEVPDYAVRHKYLDSAYKLKGSYAPEKSQSVNLTLTAPVPDSKAKQLADEYERKLKEDL